MKITTDKEGNWSAAATNLEGLITGGYATDDYDETIKDAFLLILIYRRHIVMMIC